LTVEQSHHTAINHKKKKKITKQIFLKCNKKKKKKKTSISYLGVANRSPFLCAQTTKNQSNQQTNTTESNIGPDNHAVYRARNDECCSPTPCLCAIRVANITAEDKKKESETKQKQKQKQQQNDKTGFEPAARFGA
jgi:hypothetical protein